MKYFYPSMVVKNYLHRGILIACFFLMMTIKSNAQSIDPLSVMGIPSTATLSDATNGSGYLQGSLVFITDEKSFYYYNGLQWVKIISENDKVIVDNNMFFEDTNHYYVSVRVDNDKWSVTRYSKSDINLENKATGTGAQPITLNSVQSLNYL